jgi:hypothetical protein
MSNVGDRAINGEREWIANHKFEIDFDGVMEFEGASCNIADADGKIVDTLGPQDGKVERDVHPNYKCYIMRAWTKFEKSSVVV